MATTIDSTERGGDMWIAVEGVSAGKLADILELRSRGVGPEEMTLREWLHATRFTRRSSVPKGMDLDAVGVLVPCFFRAAAKAVLEMPDLPEAST